MSPFTKPYFCISNITLEPPIIRVPIKSGIPLTIFTQGCDFNCLYCPTPQLIPKCEHTVISPERILQIISNSKFVTQLYILGGEPTQQLYLPEFCECVKSVSDKIKIILTTIGTRPEVISTLLRNNCVDTIIMNIKGPLVKERYEEITRTPVDIDKIKECIDLLKHSTIQVKSILTQTPIHTTSDIELVKEQLENIEIIPVTDLLYRI